MRIGFVINSLNSGGAERVVSVLANQMEKEGHDVSIFLFSSDPVFYELNKNVEIERVHNPLTTNSIQGLLSNYSRVQSLKKAFIKHKLDGVYGFTTSINVLTILAARAAKVKRVVVSERNDPYTAPLSKIWKVLRGVVYKKADGLVVQNELQFKFFKQQLPNLSLVKIKNPLSDFADVSNEGDQKPNFICVGRFDYWKNHKDVIDAFSKCEETATLTIIGGGEKESELKQQVENLDLADRVIFTGHVRNISKYLNYGDIFVSASLSEGFPNALVEAMSMGLACIHYNCPSGIDEIIQHQINGELIALKNTTDLASSMSNLLKNSELRLGYCGQALKVRELLSPRQITKEWLDLI